MRTDLNTREGWILSLRGYNGPLALKCRKNEKLILLKGIGRNS